MSRHWGRGRTCIVAVALLAATGCGVDDEGTLGTSPAPVRVTASRRSVRIAVIGDYGQTGDAARGVADLVRRWKPQLVITTGDNNYPHGAAATIDANVGRYYHRFIHPYRGRFGIGAARNRFFPTLGNHDWHAKDAEPYLDYFTLPGNERYYDFAAGPIQLFALDSDPKEPDGVSSTSQQARWLEQRLRDSSACWRVVYFHHAPYSSGDKRPGDWMRWPYGPWGADVVLAGHEHTYERLLVDGVTYLVVGLGGASIYQFKDPPTEGSRARYNRQHGAMLIVAERERMTFTFAVADGREIDSYTISKPCPARR